MLCDSRIACVCQIECGQQDTAPRLQVRTGKAKSGTLQWDYVDKARLPTARWVTNLPVTKNASSCPFFQVLKGMKSPLAPALWFAAKGLSAEETHKSTQWREHKSGTFEANAGLLRRPKPSISDMNALLDQGHSEKVARRALHYAIEGGAEFNKAAEWLDPAKLGKWPSTKHEDADDDSTGPTRVDIDKLISEALQSVLDCEKQKVCHREHCNRQFFVS